MRYIVCSIHGTLVFELQKLLLALIEKMVLYLQDDIMLHVFSFLDAISLCKVRRVCRKWRDLSSDEILWKHKLMSDIKTWKQISHSTNIPEAYLEQDDSSHPQET